MAEFKIFYGRLRVFEGGYVNDPLDPGGETYAGIARKYNGQWHGFAVIDQAKKDLKLGWPVPTGKYQLLNLALAANLQLQKDISAFYKPQYWDVMLLDQVVSQDLANNMADHGTNAGPARPARMIQFALNQLGYHLTEDAKVGPRTVAAINAADQDKLLAAFVELRRAHYLYRTATKTPAQPVLGLMQRMGVTPNATQAKYLRSWLRRLPK